jgi:undecaprenyl-diphosphatase
VPPVLIRVRGALGSLVAELRPWERLLVVGSALGLLLLGLDVAAGGLATYVDDAVLGRSEHTGDQDGGPVSSVGELGLATGILLVVVLVTLHATLALWPLVVAVVNVGGGLLLVVLIKAATARPGPGESALPEGYPGFFPSGHTATAGLCLGTAWFVLAAWRGYGARHVRPAVSGLFVGLVAATVVGVGSVLSSHHWASDAVGGLLVTALVLPVGFAVGTLRGAAGGARGPAR